MSQIDEMWSQVVTKYMNIAHTGYVKGRLENEKENQEIVVGLTDNKQTIMQAYIITRAKKRVELS